MTYWCWVHVVVHIKGKTKFLKIKVARSSNANEKKFKFKFCCATIIDKSSFSNIIVHPHISHLPISPRSLLCKSPPDFFLTVPAVVFIKYWANDTLYLHSIFNSLIWVPDQLN